MLSFMCAVWPYVHVYGRMSHVSNAVIWGGNIFCSFAFEDSLVEAYDQHVSPVLGGNDTLRNEQKQKRHLESW